MLVLALPADDHLGVILIQRQDTAITAQDFPPERWIVIYYRHQPLRSRFRLPNVTDEIKEDDHVKEPVMSLTGDIPLDGRFFVPRMFQPNLMMTRGDFVSLSVCMSQRIKPMHYRTLYLLEDVHAPLPIQVPQPMLCVPKHVRLPPHLWARLLGSVEVVVVKEPEWIAAALCAGCKVVTLDLEIEWLDYPGVGCRRVSTLFPTVYETWNLKEDHTSSHLGSSLCEWYEDLMNANLKTENFFWRVLGYDTSADWYEDTSFVRTASQRECVLKMAELARDPCSLEDETTDTNDEYSPNGLT
jgi:hypothetical protein